MISALDVDTGKLIEKAAQKLQDMGIKKPSFVGIVKTGPNKDRPPENANFWYVRCASILHQAYLHNNLGTNSLRSHYGGRKSRGAKPNRTVRSGGSTIRKALQELENNKLLEKTVEKRIKNKVGKEVIIYKGRKLTSKGRKFLDGLAKEIGIG